ncbi:MAG: tetratricopeptide repeat protein [Desulfobacteraceae bacterium]|nr:tetratricopeptide repeat protein [Desulfobacteraceae bacterium]MCF8035630.1 tetratricopeptide repeat protein [Desulfobacteraceae bacterium]
MIDSKTGFDLGIRWQFPDAKRYAFVFFALFIALLVIYGNSFNNAFQFDDTPNILENHNVQPESLSWDELKKSFYGINQGHGKIKRPLSYLTLAVNYYFSGENVFSYHVVNFAIHLITSVFLFLLVYNTLQLPLLKPRYAKSAYAIALLAVFFWATHPIQLTAVTYIVQRMAALAGMFYVMAMYFYLKARTSPRRPGQIIFFSLCGIAVLLGFASKENAAMLPVVLFLFDFFLIQGVNRENLKSAAWFAVLPVLIFVLVAIFYVEFSSFLSGYESRPFTLFQRLMTQPRVLMLYVSLLVYPVSSRLMLIHDIPLSHSLLDPWTTAASIVLILAAAAAALYYSRKWPLLAFCVIFFFINHVIESSIIPLELVYEHRNYIPSMFFFVVVATVMVSVLDYFSYRTSIQLIMAFGFCFLLAAQAHTTYERNKIWQHEILLWSDNAEKAPGLSRVHTNLGNAYADAGINSEAVQRFQKALELKTVMRENGMATLLHNFGVASFHKGEEEVALRYFRRALAVNPGKEDTLYLLCRLYLKRGKLENAYQEIKGRVRDVSDIRSPELFKIYALVMYHRGKTEQAMALSRKALQRDPDHAGAFPILAKSFERLGKLDMAESYWRRYLEKHPKSLKAHLALIELYVHKGDHERLSTFVGDLFCLSKNRDLCETIVNKYNPKNLYAIYTPDMKIIRDAVEKAMSEKAARFLKCTVAEE